ncbi:MAG: TMEM43 family protein [Verrucomicrobiales bacterium]|nr:TMEM43 family protein [Verrucomicrobiales bacterium]
MANLTEVTRQGLGSRGKNSIGGAIFGFLLVAISAVVLFWNEGRSVKRYKDLNEGSGKVVSVSSDTVNPANEGQLVHLTGEAKTSTPLVDDTFGISGTAIKLNRSVEMYQWIENVRSEEREKVGGSVETTKTYSYSKEWRSSVVDSSRFKDRQGYRNPSSMKYQSKSTVANEVTFGAFQLPPFLISKMTSDEPLYLESLDAVPAAIKEQTKLHNGGLYFGSDPAAPSVGDLRVSFSLVPPGPISVVAQQAGNSFTSYSTKTGGKLDLLSRGTKTAEEMFTAAHEANKIMTWGIRVVGFFLMMSGFSMILKPLAVFASILPFLGRIVETGTNVIAFLLAGILWTIVVAVAWIFYRPILGIAILVVTVALIVLIVKRLRTIPAPDVSSTPGTPPPLDTPPPLN